MPILHRFSPQIYALMRIVVAFLFSLHGVQKLFGLLGDAVPLASLRGLAGTIEFFGGILIGLGLFAPFAAFIASGEMATAYFLQHAPRGFWPILNGGERSAFYCFVFLYIATRGSGIWSVDAARKRSTT